MPDEFIMDAAPALDLEIRGAVGSFSVKPRGDRGSSIPVKYIQTHVRFAMDGGHQQKLFENLIPVREIFDQRELGFEEMMQRDIDDNRVSNSLIPYLISVGHGEHVKFFPPIVTVLLPLGPERQILDFYPPMSERVEAGPSYNRKIMRSGDVGFETFQFEQLERNGELQEFDNARLRINVTKSKIVIVDGQHRAMALLALYRNLNLWPEKTTAFKPYYKIWSRDLLRDNLKEISLPIVVCTFPTLTEGAGHEMTVVKACRSIFLALNKNARPVTDARNILLDDYDLIALFERSVLEAIKDLNINSPHALRLWNFELDADENKVQLKSTISLSGVMHLYSMLERVLLADQEPVGLNYPSKKYKKIKNIENTCLHRLDAKNILGEEIAKTTFRYSFTPEAGTKLLEAFNTKYRGYIVRAFQEFYPFEAMAKAAIKLELQVKDERHDMECHAMLFEGQGIHRVSESYEQQLRSDLAERYPDGNIPPESEEILDHFHSKHRRLKDYQERFFRMRTEILLDQIAARKLVDTVHRSVQDLFKTIFTITAFQNGLFMTVFSTIEKINSKNGRTDFIYADDQDTRVFDSFIAAMNAFFYPQNDNQAKRLLSVFSGKVGGRFGTEEMVIAETDANLRSIVFQNELKPDEWGKFRYLLLEIWKLSNPEQPILEVIDHYLTRGRQDVLKAYAKRSLIDFCREKGVDISQLKESQADRIKNRCLDNYLDALHTLGLQLTPIERADLHQAIFGTPLTADESENQDSDDEAD